VAPAKAPIDPELLARLAGLMDTWQLTELIDVCETVKAAGCGWGEVSLLFKGGNLDQIDGHFSRKPRRDQSSLFK
jgi:hypothetical protein